MLTPHKVLFDDVKHKNKKAVPPVSENTYNGHKSGRAQTPTTVQQQPIQPQNDTKPENIDKKIYSGPSTSTSTVEKDAMESEAQWVHEEDASVIKPDEKKDMIMEGHKEAIKDTVKEHDIEKQKLQKLLAESNTVLMTFKSVFPFDFFPDEVTIDVKRVNVKSKAFFSSARIHSIDVQDIQDVFIETSPFFASLKLVVKGFIENSVEVKFIKKNEAVRARKIIQGLITSSKEDVDLSKIEDKNLAVKMEELGRIKN